MTDSESDEESDIEPVHHGVPRRSSWYWYERRKKYVHVNFNKEVRVQEQIYLGYPKRYRYSRSSSLNSYDNDRASISSLEPTSEEEAAVIQQKEDIDVHRTLWFTKILPELCKKFSEEWLAVTFGDNYKEYNERAARIIAHVRSEESELRLDDDLRDQKIPQSIKEAEIQAVIESVEETVCGLVSKF